jgi:hypothetical protein
MQSPPQPVLGEPHTFRLYRQKIRTPHERTNCMADG